MCQNLSFAKEWLFLSAELLSEPAEKSLQDLATLSNIPLRTQILAIIDMPTAGWSEKNSSTLISIFTHAIFCFREEY